MLYLLNALASSCAQLTYLLLADLHLCMSLIYKVCSPISQQPNSHKRLKLFPSFHSSVQKPFEMIMNSYFPQYNFNLISTKFRAFLTANGFMGVRQESQIPKWDISTCWFACLSFSKFPVSHWMAKGKMSSSSLDALNCLPTSDSEEQTGEAWVVFRVALSYSSHSCKYFLQYSSEPAAAGLSETERLWLQDLRDCYESTWYQTAELQRWSTEMEENLEAAS